MSSAAVEIRNLTKRIGRKIIVDGLSLDIRAGEVFGLLGPNGAGKTTTIRMMVGLMSITSGQVRIQGYDIRREFEQAISHVGAIVENPEMYTFLSGYDNLKLYARMAKDVSDQRINKVIRFVGLEHAIHQKVASYSLGMRQRLGLAQALLHRPSVLILDEPTNGLDPAGIRQLRDHLRQLAETEDVCVIVSSHLLSEMELMCDRVAILQQGRLVKVQDVRPKASAPQAALVAFEVDVPAAARQALAGIASAEEHAENGIVMVRARREDIPEINARLVQHGVRVYGIRQVTKSLEEQFLEVTGGSAGAPTHTE